MCIPKNDAGTGLVGGTRWTGLATRFEGGAGALICEYPASVRPKAMQKTRENIALKTRRGAFIVESPRRDTGYPAQCCDRDHPGPSCGGIYTRRNYAGLMHWFAECIFLVVRRYLSSSAAKRTCPIVP